MTPLQDLNGNQTLDVCIEYVQSGLIRACRLYNQFLELNGKPPMLMEVLMPAVKRYYEENLSDSNKITKL